MTFRWTEAHDTRLLGLRARGMAFSEIAHYLGCAKSAAAHRYYQLCDPNIVKAYRERQRAKAKAEFVPILPRTPSPAQFQRIPALTEIEAEGVSKMEESSFDRDVEACAEHLADLVRVYGRAPVPQAGEGRYLPSALPPISVYAERASILGSPAAICAADGGKAVDKGWR